MSYNVFKRFVVGAALALLVQMSTTGELIGADPKETETEWKAIFSFNGARGGFKQFTVHKDTRVQFEWDVTTQPGPTSFRVTIAKQNPRTGRYQTQGVLAQTSKSVTSKKKGKLKAGHYQLYFAMKNSRASFVIKAEKAD